MRKRKARGIEKRIPYTPSKRSLVLLERMLGQGIYGHTMAEVVRRLVDEGLQRRFFKK